MREEEPEIKSTYRVVFAVGLLLALLGVITASSGLTIFGGCVAVLSVIARARVRSPQEHDLTAVEVLLFFSVLIAWILLTGIDIVPERWTGIGVGLAVLVVRFAQWLRIRRRARSSNEAPN